MSYERVVKREINRYIASPLAWIVSFIFPLLMCIIICLIFHKASPTDLPIGVFDADNSQISRKIVRDLNTLQSCNVKYRTTSLEEGHQLLIEGKIYGFIMIPKNFQRDIYRMNQPKLVYYYNNQRILIGGIITKDRTALAQSYIVALDAKMKSKKGIPYDEAIKQSN
ncbi:MAG: ABC transporter permease, partial [bacterium]|nr:ABC transporter permease [bacterium]